MLQFQKKVYHSIVCLLIGIFSLGAIGNVYAQSVEKDSRSWSESSVRKGQEIGFLPNELSVRSSDFITRKELSKLLVEWYQVFTGKAATSDGVVPFSDDQSGEVRFLYTKGIIKGVSDDSFGPDVPVSREQMAVILSNLLQVSGVTTTAYSSASYADYGEISSYAVNAVNFLTEKGILSGYEGMFSPHSLVSIEQCAVLLVHAYEIYEMPSLRVGNVSIELGSDKNEVLKQLGEPDQIVKNEYDMEKYIFSDPWNNFLTVSFDGNTVFDLFSNSPQLIFRGKTCSDPATTISELGLVEAEHADVVVLKSETSHIQVNITSDTGIIDAISISKKDAEKKRVYTAETAAGVEQALFAMLNSSRIKNGHTALNWSSFAAKSAKLHSQDMKQFAYESYTGSDGSTPFDRMKKEGIVFTSATEATARVTEGAFAGYCKWMDNIGIRTGLLDFGYQYGGIGVTAGKNAFFIVMDLYQE